MQQKTIREATYGWIQTFNMVDGDLIRRAFRDDIDYWMELTTAVVGDYVEYRGDDIELIQPYDLRVEAVDTINEEVSLTLAHGRDIEMFGKVIRVSFNDTYMEHDGLMPLCETLFSPSNLCDKNWIYENAAAVSACGIRIFKDAHIGTLYLGIDGRDYDFYEAHWIPLYQLRACDKL